MTEYNEQVEAVRRQMERERQWREAKYIHANNGEVKLGKLSFGEVMKVWKGG